MRRVNFDLDALRSFSVGMELGSFAKAADKLGRSTSAVSAQLKKLEEQAGTPLLRKEGRGLGLTDAGEVLLSYARRILELNDEAWMAVGGLELEGWVRLGLQEDFGEHLLSDVLGRFARSHPGVRIEAKIARNGDAVDRTCQPAAWALAQKRRAGAPGRFALGLVSCTRSRTTLAGRRDWAARSPENISHFVEISEHMFGPDGPPKRGVAVGSALAAASSSGLASSGFGSAPAPGSRNGRRLAPTWTGSCTLNKRQVSSTSPMPSE